MFLSLQLTSQKPKTLKELAEEYFLKMYEYANIYYEHNGSLDINEKFNTDDGFTYKADGKIRLGRWVHNQVKRATPDTPHGQMLAQIGMIWDYNANKRAVYDLCRQYRIDTEINYYLVNHISAQEFQETPACTFPLSQAPVCVNLILCQCARIRGHTA